MRNQPLNSVLHAETANPESLIDPPARTRFVVLGAAFLVGAVVVLGRIAWVQATLQDRYLETLNSTTIEYETIPARNGRILSDGSEVYAVDVDQYTVEMHYRWLQDPPDERWISRQVRRRLSAEERSQPEVVERTENDLQTERLDGLKNLLSVTGLSAKDFARRRQNIQERVGRIADSVNRRHFQSATTSETEPTDDNALIRMANAVRSALTTTPRRRTAERIVVREEESFHQIRANVDFGVAAQIREQPRLFPGVRVVVSNRRTYPNKTVAAHVIGARTERREDENRSGFSKKSRNSPSSDVGRFGVERSYDHQLRSVPGLRKIVRSYRMEILDSSIEREPVSGRDVVLTLNHPLQMHAEQLLAEAMLDRPFEILAPNTSDEEQLPQPIPTGGSIVAMDVVTGRLLAVASAPAFDLTLFTDGSEEAWRKINSDKRFPFLSRTTSTALPPGSVMKPVTAAAALESGGLNPDDEFYCQGFLTQPDEHRCLVFRLYNRGHGDINLTRALGQSCNVYFFSAARRMGFKSLRMWADRFGFGRRTGVDVPFEKRGNLPGSARVSDNVDMSRETLGFAIGQAQLTVTPLQMVRAIAAIANGGWLVTPHLVSPDGVARDSRDTDDRPHSISRRRITDLSDQTLERIREGMEAVVQQPWGTGHKTVRLDGVKIAGKTGTAETARGRPDHAWFAGYVPADNPQIAFVVVLENGGSGSRAAGPVARELVREMLRLSVVTPADDAATDRSD